MKVDKSNKLLTGMEKTIKEYEAKGIFEFNGIVAQVLRQGEVQIYLLKNMELVEQRRLWRGHFMEGQTDKQIAEWAIRGFLARSPLGIKI